MYSENNDFNSILKRLLDQVDDGLDKREGSIIYDALAPAAAELAQCYIALDLYAEQTYLLDAVGENLDKRGIETGITRREATASLVILNAYDNNEALMSINIGSRFAVPNEYGGYNFKVISEQSVGTYIAECETTGIVGNSYIGDVLPLQSINNLGNATIISIYKPGEDTETDEELRSRILLKLNQEAFAGNKAAYRQMTIDIDGVEDCKVYPVWNGGGTVKLALIGPNHTLLSMEAVNAIQEMIDPTPQGTGIGLAPIGHTVTVVTPTADNLTITATLELETGATISQVTPSVVTQLQSYIYQVQSDFIDKDTLIIYLAKISAAILNVKEIKNVVSVTINGQAVDYTIDNTAGTTIKYPMLDATGVILNENS